MLAGGMDQTKGPEEKCGGPTFSLPAGLHGMSRSALPRPPHHDALHPLKQRAEQVLCLGLPVPGMVMAPERLTGLVVAQGGRRKKGNVPGKARGSWSFHLK